MQDPLFQPIKIGKLEIRNRIYMPAMHLNMAKDFYVTQQLLNFYSQRAKGGAGLICVGFASIDKSAGMPLCIGAHDDKFIPGLKKLASTIKNFGAHAAIQLNHTGRYNFSFFLNGKEAVAPSPVYSRLTKETPRQLTHDEIISIIEAFAEAAKRVKSAGFDAVEILHGTGYLISSFISPVTNMRNDMWGGSFENRIRFGIEVTMAVKKAVGDDFPVIARINGNELMPEGSTRAELLKYAQILSEKGVNALCVNVGWHESPVPQIIASVPPAAFGYLARGIKEKVDIPVIASHRINEPKLAREMINSGICDMVALGRSLIADPYFPEKARTGQEEKIIHCIACAQACFDNVFKLKPIECVVNPVAGHENERQAVKTSSPSKVIIIGGGPAGMSAALAAAERGHRVKLFERSHSLGGQFILASVIPGRKELLRLVQDFHVQLIHKGVEIITNCEVDANLIEEEKPDAVIIAIGAKPASVNIPGCNLPHVSTAWEVLSGKARIGKHVVIIGGGAVGVETALFISNIGTLTPEIIKFLLLNEAEKPEEIKLLATSGTREVTLVEMTAKLGKDIGKTTRWALLQEIDRYKVKQLLLTKAVAINPDAVIVETGKDKKRLELKADTVIIAAGAVPENTEKLRETCKKISVPVKVVGDCVVPATAYEAVHQGYIAGLEILS